MKGESGLVYLCGNLSITDNATIFLQVQKQTLNQKSTCVSGTYSEGENQLNV